MTLTSPEAGTSSKSSSIYDIPLKDIDGKDTSLKAYEGKVLLIVNTASECGYTSQYKGLEALYRKLDKKGFVVLGFPSNDFGGQEPGDEKKIKFFCKENYEVSFPMFSKISIKSNPHPLYATLVKEAGDGTKVSWNFNKFLVDGKGHVVKHYASGVAPDDPKLLADITAILGK